MSAIRRIYLGLTLVFAGSSFVLFWAQDGSFVEAIAAVPLVGSLVGALFQMFRDSAAHERSLLLLDAQQHFALGASSHMAMVAFDKHVLFSEAYLKEAQAALHTLFREGASEKVLADVGRLYSLRQEYVVWLTPEVEAGLDIFEQALRELGATAGFVRSTEQSAQYKEQRSKAIDAMYKKLAQVMAFPEWSGEKLTDDLAIAAVIRRLRKLLGTEELTSMRHAIVAKACGALSVRAN